MVRFEKMLRMRPGRKIAVAVWLLGSLATPVMAAERAPTVVELFTSQGCSSCPPANANLAKVSDRPGVIALSFGVTYWDRLGWKDTFGRKDYTARQAAYEAPLGESGPFTPQIVVGGRASIVGDDLASVERLIADDAAVGRATIVGLTPGAVSVAAGRAPREGADIWLVRYDPRQVDVPVRHGENGGRTLPHKNVVRDLALVGRWTGAAVTAAITRAPDGLRTAVLVQASGGGRILAATSD